MPFRFSNSYLDLPPQCYARVRPTPVAAPQLLAFNANLAHELGFEAEEIAAAQRGDLTAVFAGNSVPEGAASIALAYAGHQFGGFVPQLGDGRAILLGEVLSRHEQRFDVQLKGSGRTPFSRGGDGRAALGPVLREYLLSEAMAVYGVPTTRALAAVTTGEIVQRESTLPGAVLTRVASSHLRVGTFQYFAARGDNQTIKALTAYALARHFPQRDPEQNDGLALLSSVLRAQAKLVAHWLGLGFVHGVMNTDNTAISGETLDFGPCAFLDAYVPNRTFSSIDRLGRYGFQNQPRIALWNLTRLAETLFSVVDADDAQAESQLVACLETYEAQFAEERRSVFRRKLGLVKELPEDEVLADDLLKLMAAARADYTLTFRHLAAAFEGKRASFLSLFEDLEAAEAWLERWLARVALDEAAASTTSQLLTSANPLYIPRNHQVERVIEAATRGELEPFNRFHAVLSQPYTAQPGAEEFEEPPGAEQFDYRTFCGT